MTPSDLAGAVNRQLRLRARPTGLVTDDDFELVETGLPDRPTATP